MAVVRCEVNVAASAVHVWDYVTDWPRQGEWIPFTRVEAVGAAREVGGRVAAFTGVGRVGFLDPMTITSWESPHDGTGRCEVLHTGSVVRGEGEFSVHASGSESCVFVWSERLDVPGGRVGELAWRAIGPLVRRGVEAAIGQMAARAEESYGAR